MMVSRCPDHAADVHVGVDDDGQDEVEDEDEEEDEEDDGVGLGLGALRKHGRERLVSLRFDQ
jgi:hypothetical protein